MSGQYAEIITLVFIYIGGLIAMACGMIIMIVISNIW